MQVIRFDNTVWFDVDGTLIHHLNPSDEIYLGSKNVENFVQIKCPFSDEKKYYEINRCHVKLLKNCKAQSKHIIVWSSQGCRWCEAVVEALNIEKYVDLCIGKPHIIVDDHPMEEWAICNLFLKGGFGK